MATKLLPQLCIATSSHSRNSTNSFLSNFKQGTFRTSNRIKVNANFQFKPLNFLLSGSLALAISLSEVAFAEGKIGVNKPELLPEEFTTVIDVAGFLSDGQEKRLAQVITDIERDTGFKLRILAQNYPDTPGLAIKDFWKVDDKTIVFVADPTFGNILNFNVGASVDIEIPQSFWSRLAGKYGNIFYWREKGEDASIESAVMAISTCLREPDLSVEKEIMATAATKAGILTTKGLEDMLMLVLRNCKNVDTMKKIHSQMVKFSLTHSNFLVTKMIDFCEKNGDIDYACLLFKQVQGPNIYLFNSIIRAYSQNKMYRSCIYMYMQLLLRRQAAESEEPVSPDTHTYPFVIRSCGGLTCADIGKQLHGHVFKFGLDSNHVIQNSLLDMYVKCCGEDSIREAQNLFDEMTVKDVISWNSLISGYIKSGKVKRANALFEEMPEKSIVSWTAMISGYTKMGCYREALNVFRRMQTVGGLEPDWVCLVAVLSGCAHLGALEVGEWVHFYAAKKGFLRKTRVCNALMEMYAKCGNVDGALEVFDRMPSSDRDVISWSTMIVGLANHGRAHDAIMLFKRMDVLPNEITFVGLLSACGHAGLVDDGLRYFDSMRDDYAITPEIEHYGCLVDLLARTGNQKRALDIINRMPMKADSAIWGSVLSSCRTVRDVETAVVAAEHLAELEPDDSGNYVLLTNVYADLGKWDYVSMMRRFMRRRRMKKTPGCSLIELDGLVHEFLSGDDSMPFSNDICQVLRQLLTLHTADDEDEVYVFL